MDFGGGFTEIVSLSIKKRASFGDAITKAMMITLRSIIGVGWDVDVVPIPFWLLLIV